MKPHIIRRNGIWKCEGSGLWGKSWNLLGAYNAWWMAKKEDALHRTRCRLPGMIWHQMPVSKFSHSYPDRPTRCVFCLTFFQILEET